MKHKNQTSHANLIGKIIFANLLKFPPKKYKALIKETKAQSQSKKLKVKVYKLSKISAYAKDNLILSNIVAKIVKYKNTFAIKHTYEGFNKKYCVSARKNISTSAHKYTDAKLRLLYKLRRISSRNELTYKVLKGIIKHQGKYLTTGNLLDLVELSQTELVNSIKGKVYNSWISRLISKLAIVTPHRETKPLKFFFASSKQINKCLIKEVLDRESKLISSNKTQKPYSDNKLKNILFKKYKKKLSRCSIAKCRKELGIPSSIKRRTVYKYPPISVTFSARYSLNTETLNNNTPITSGVYELSLKEKELKYPNCFTSVIYIGRSTNIKKRLKDYLADGNKNKYVKNFVRRHKCYFRYCLLKYKPNKEEKKLYNLFVKCYGAPPKCNKLSP